MLSRSECELCPDSPVKHHVGMMSRLMCELCRETRHPLAHANRKNPGLRTGGLSFDRRRVLRSGPSGASIRQLRSNRWVLTRGLLTLLCGPECPESGEQGLESQAEGDVGRPF